ncbi:hypothetical protein [Desulfuromonas versatilis]|nr:hypothetical protein [Desulfuromonas versatilis]
MNYLQGLSAAGSTGGVPLKNWNRTLKWTAPAASLNRFHFRSTEVNE